MRFDSGNIKYLAQAMAQKNTNAIFSYSLLCTNVWSECQINPSLLSNYQNTRGIISGEDTHPKLKFPLLSLYKKTTYPL